MRSLSPTASPRPGQRHEIEWACLTRSPAPSGFLDLLTLSSAPSLVALFRATSAHGVVPSRALLLSRSRSPSPAPLPSCRFDEPADRATARRLWPKPAAPLGIRHGPGSALAFRALLHARVRHRPAAFYTAARRVALLGFHPPGFSPSLARRDLHRTSPHGLHSSRRERPDGRTPQGLTSSEIGWSLSRLPTLLGFVAFRPSRTFGSDSVRESPPQAPGCVTVP
jgi:hypothetical protein